MRVSIQAIKECSVESQYHGLSREKIAELRRKAEKKEKIGYIMKKIGKSWLKKLKKSENKAENLTPVCKHMAHSP